MSILLPENTEEQQIKKYVNDAIEAARLCNVIYSGGHTEVTSLVNRPVLNITAIGYLSEEALTDGKRVTCNGKGKPGQSLVITKCVALEGTAMLAWEKFDELTARYPVPFIDGARNFKYDLYV